LAGVRARFDDAQTWGVHGERATHEAKRERKLASRFKRATVRGKRTPRRTGALPHLCRGKAFMEPLEITLEGGPGVIPRYARERRTVARELKNLATEDTLAFDHAASCGT
jgi:hypothetical protein